MANQYEPWVAMGISEAEYFKRRYIEARTDPTLALYNYFTTELAQGKIDFCIRARMDGAAVEFYIRPEGKDGQTADFRLEQEERIELKQKGTSHD